MLSGDGTRRILMESNELFPRISSTSDSGTHVFFEFSFPVGILVSKEDSDNDYYSEDES